MYGPCANAEKCSEREGNIVLGGLFPLSSWDSTNSRCTNATNSRFFFETVQWVEAMRRAIERVNSNQTLLPGVTLGYEIRDTCFQISNALQEALKFIQTSTCDGSKIAVAAVPLVGVVGSYSSSICLQVTNLLGSFNIPMVSYAATNARLSDARYNYFFRVLPSDRFSSKAIREMVRYYRWTYVSVVYSDDAFGRGGAEAVRAEFETLRNPSVCIAAYRSLHEHATLKANLTDYQSVINDLLNTAVSKQHNNATAVVLFLQPGNARDFLTLASHTPGILQGNFTFIGLDSWGDVLSIVEGVALPASLGALSPIPFSVQVPDFDTHLQAVRPGTNSDNPWLAKLWPAIFNCSISEADCMAKSLTSAEAKYRQSSKIALVYDAVQVRRTRR